MKLILMATAAFGLEAVTAGELKDLGFENVVIENGHVLFETDERGLIRANLWLRTAERVFVVIGRFKAMTFEQLFDQTTALPWETYIPLGGKFPVDAKSVKSKLFSLSDIQSISKKAVVKRLSEKYGVEWLPEEKGDYAIQVSILKDEVIVALDASGTGLHKRGYREIGTEAPMKETLAAGLLIISKWRPNIPLIDPFCGSGTIVIEAALMAQNIAPGLNRTFAFVDWEWIEDSLYKAERTAAYGAIRQEEEISIQGYDKDPKAIRVAKHNAEVAGVDEVIHLQVRDVEAFSTKAPFGSIICNPPYGERLNALSEAEALYRLMGRVFAPYTTWSKYILTSHEGFEALYGERATKNRKLYNGRIKTYFYQYFGKRRPSSEKGPNQ